MKTTAGIAALSKAAGFARDHFGRDSSFVRGFVGQHRVAGHVADRQDVRIGGPLLRITNDESSLVDFDLRVFETQSLESPVDDRC